MSERDMLEVFLDNGGGLGRLLCSTESIHAPEPGDLINIVKVTYRVIERSYTVDHANEHHLTSVSCVLRVTVASNA